MITGCCPRPTSARLTSCRKTGSAGCPTCCPSTARTSSTLPPAPPRLSATSSTLSSCGKWTSAPRSHLDCSRTAHPTVLARRRSLASVVIDNVCDGHYGLAGQEAAILGLPVVGFNHPRTLEAMEDGAARAPSSRSSRLRQSARRRRPPPAQPGRQPCRTAARSARGRGVPFPAPVIGEYWDPFIDEVAG